MTRSSTICEYDGTIDPSNSDALVDISGENVLEYSNDFSNWTTTRVVISSSAAYDYQGISFDAEGCVPSVDNDTHVITKAFTGLANSIEYTMSAYIKPGNGDWVMLENASIANATCYFDVTNGTVGTAGAGILDSGMVGPLPNGFYRCWIRFISNAGNDTLGIYLAEADTDNSFIGDATNVYLYAGGIQCKANNNRIGHGPGLYMPTDANNKPSHNLAPTNAPSWEVSPNQDRAGNRIQAKTFDTTNYYSKAHHNSMNVFTGDHTITIVAKLNAAAAGDDYLLAHGLASTNGLSIYGSVGSSKMVADYGKAAANATAEYTGVTVNDGLYHVFQIVRSSDTATFYYDGVAGTGVDVSTYGIDASKTLYIGSADAGATPVNGSILYCRIDTEALSITELVADKARILGSAEGFVPVRASEGVLEHSPRSISRVVDNVPRVTDGVLVEAEVDNECGYSEEFDQWVQFGTCAVTVDNTTAPDSSVTADLVDNTGGVSTHYRSFSTTGASISASEIWTYSLWLRADTPHLCTLQIRETGTAGITSTSVAVTSEWQRLSIELTMVGGGTGEGEVRLYPGQLGVATGIIHAWGAQFEQNGYPTSYIETPTSAAVTREADDITFDSSNTLPLEISDTAQYKDLTIEFEAKCDYSAAADLIGAKSILEISGNTGTAGSGRNRIYFLVLSTGVVRGLIYDDASASHFGYTGADPIDFSEWATYKLYLPMDDLSNMAFTMTQDGAAVGGILYTDNSGTMTFDTTNVAVRLGQANNGAVSGDCKIRNLKIWIAE
jgi:hypothetical protein